ncbi:MAG: oxygenase MpaB family protein [Gordonia sp. (in: high G+C Gram-positive bacteria)]|uniref:oxygenase MpaB family protein n=1 Tax=Gordonia sp. (in: high G+C Gram-positive bacteria) TaxID=84139 RepID=UPI003BB5248E
MAASETIPAPSASDGRRVPMPLVYRYLGDKRFAYTLPRALSLQILHPGNAASLVQHVHGGLWAHKQRAISEMVYIAYSSRDLRSVMRTAHTHVKGVDSLGLRYHSLNPDLFFFQHATYVETLITSIEVFHRPLRREEKDELYQQCRLWYAKYDISDRAQPADYGEFVDYFDEFCQRELVVSPDVAALRHEALHPGTWFPKKVPHAAIRALLHPRAAELLNVEPGAADRAALKAFAAQTRLRAGLTPAKYRLIPAARHRPED